MTPRKLQKFIHELAVKHGWWNPRDSSIIPTKLVLIHSEVSEALECYREHQLDTTFKYTKDSKSYKPLGFGSELADVVIRCFDLAEYLHIDLWKIIELKHEYNITRPYRHGGKAA